MSTWSVPGYAESRELGSGASGRVALAVHEETGLPVAVKYLSESLRTRPGFVREFRAEARLLGGLRSAHVAGLYEYVEGPDGAAIVMELVDGVSLRTLLGREAPLTPEAALVLLKGSLLGLADAHRLGVVHRDYKPENVLVRADGTSKLVDFGIAAADGSTAGIAGTPSYMAPEQWTGAPASPAADVYAATATFFECLTGRKPYTGENLAELALQHVDGPIPADEAPEPVRGLVRRGLAKSPEQRPSHAEDFVAELEAAAGGAYGPDWEERGRGRLAALAALSLLLPRQAPGGPRDGTTDTARTVLHRTPDFLRVWRPDGRSLLLSAAAIVAALLLTYGVDRHAPAFGTPGQAAQALATTSARPGSADGVPVTADPESPAPSASAPVSATATASGAADATATPTAPPDTATATVAAPPTSAAPPTGEPTTTPPSASPSPEAGVESVVFGGFRQTGTATATASLTVTTDGTGPVTITVTWSTGDEAGQVGAQDGAADTYQRGGATQYTIALDHTFQGAGCYWNVRAGTQPVSADGGASQQLLTRRCAIR
ncbi:protein kinase [Streptomyces sp. NPDC007084]|uniref:protein kinase domain-containing protein n=1 Tax=Streptomyces sp. NPDC007084 TaxID=3154313 RepID=UPI003454A91F